MKAPDGKVIDRIDLQISKPAARAPVALVEVGREVALDLFKGDRRIQRVFVPGLVPGGQPISLDKFI